MATLTPEERERYDRQIMIDGLGEAGQQKLKRARVFIAGAGGLGSAVSLYLTAAGVGTIRIVDHDKVELSNLNRQVLHRDEDIGQPKVGSAAARLSQLNPNVKIETDEVTITETNIARLVTGFDLIIDALDNLPTRYLLNKAAIEQNIPLFHGAINGFEGRAMTIIPGQTACLACVYHGAIPDGKIPVVGVTPAIIGCIQATEVIKYITGLGELLINRLLVYDGLSMKFTEFKVRKDPKCRYCAHLASEGKAD